MDEKEDNDERGSCEDFIHKSLWRWRANHALKDFTLTLIIVACLLSHDNYRMLIIARLLSHDYCRTFAHDPWISLAVFQRCRRRLLRRESIVMLDVTEKSRVYMKIYMGIVFFEMFYPVHICIMDVLIYAAYPLSKVWGRRAGG